MTISKPLQSLLLLVAVAKAVDPSTFFGGSGNGVYLDWLNSSDYARSKWLSSTSDAGLGVAVHWNTNSTHIELAVASKAIGWVGFGIAEAGSMKGADIVMYTAAADELVDSHVLDELAYPVPDVCQSWTLVRSLADDGFIIFEAYRLLDTGDSQDRVIIDDSDEVITATRVIAAWGNESSPSYHGAANRVKGVIRFMSKTAVDELESFQESMAAEAEGTFIIAAQDFVIPAVETTYEKFCFAADDLLAMGIPLDQDLHTIGIEPIIDTRSAQYVHHFVLRASSLPVNIIDCASTFFLETAYAWAPGEMPMRFPYNVGGPLGSSGFTSFQLEIHYNNPQLDDGRVDSSGVKFFYTSKKRQYDLGIFETGDPLMGLIGTPVNSNGGLSEHTFDCGSSCSSSFLNQSVTVVTESLHMHMSGVRMSNSHVRNGEVIRRAEAQFWDFDQQGSLTVVQQPFTIAPGDSFRTSCIYNTKNDEQFGLASSQEMCIAFLFYYPRQAFNFGDLELPYLCGMRFGDFYPACNVDWSNSSLSDMSQVGRSFGVAPSTCPAPPVAISSMSPTAAPASPDSEPTTASPIFSGAVLEPSDSSTVSPTAAPVFPDSKSPTLASPTSSGAVLKPSASSTVTLATTVWVGLMVIHAALVAYL